MISISFNFWSNSVIYDMILADGYIPKLNSRDRLNDFHDHSINVRKGTSDFGFSEAVLLGRGH